MDRSFISSTLSFSKWKHQWRCSHSIFITTFIFHMWWTLPRLVRKMLTYLARGHTLLWCDKENRRKEYAEQTYILTWKPYCHITPSTCLLHQQIPACLAFRNGRWCHFWRLCPFKLSFWFVCVCVCEFCLFDWFWVCFYFTEKANDCFILSTKLSAVDVFNTEIMNPGIKYIIFSKK